MSIRTLVVLGLAIICGGSSAAGVYLMRGKETPEAIETVSVFVAARNIDRGEVVGKPMLTTREWPKAYVPQSAVVDPTKIVDGTAMAPILAGEPILQGKIADPKAGSGLATLIPIGHRAYTIRTSHAGSNVAGFVEPGNRVDVLLTLRGAGREDKTGGGSTTTLLQAVEILAVDQHLDGPSQERSEQLRSVTLLVTPEQVALLDLGHNMGTLALSLRNPGDVDEARTNTATVNLLRYHQESPNMDFESWSNRSSVADDLPKLFPDDAATVVAKPVVEAEAMPIPDPPIVKIQKPKKQYLQTFTLRGRSSGRIMVLPSQ